MQMLDGRSWTTGTQEGDGAATSAHSLLASLGVGRVAASTGEHPGQHLFAVPAFCRLFSHGSKRCTGDFYFSRKSGVCSYFEPVATVVGAFELGVRLGADNTAAVCEENAPSLSCILLLTHTCNASLTEWSTVVEKSIREKNICFLDFILSHQVHGGL